MLITGFDECGIPIYMACNDAGLCLIITRSHKIAAFVSRASKGVNPELRLTVGGDPGTSQPKPPIWQFVRKLEKT